MRQPPVAGEPVPPGPPSWYRQYWWGLLLLALAGVALLIVIIWLATTNDDGSKATVPNVVGLQQAEAVNEVRAQGLEPLITYKASTAPKGQVIGETPSAGSKVEKGHSVVLTVSGSSPTTTPTTTAKTTTVTKTTTVAVTTTQTQTQATTVTQPTTTTAPKLVTMPDVVGQADYAQAVQEGASAGLLPQTYPVASTEPQGTVVDQSPAAGTQVRSDVPVRLDVSLGPGTRSEGPLPDLTGLKAQDALVKCAARKYTCRIAYRTAPQPSTVGKVIDQKPAAGTTAPGLTQITLYVAK